MYPIHGLTFSKGASFREDEERTRVTRLIRVALKDTDPAGQAQLRELLGLDL